MNAQRITAAATAFVIETLDRGIAEDILVWDDIWSEVEDHPERMDAITQEVAQLIQHYRDNTPLSISAATYRVSIATLEHAIYADEISFDDVSFDDDATDAIVHAIQAIIAQLQYDAAALA